MNRKAAIFLGILSLSIIVMRLHTYNEPLEWDITTYAVIAHEMLDGRKLYSDLWDHKPPAIHVTFAAAEIWGGYGPFSIYLLTVCASIATLFGIFFLCSLKGRAAPYWAGIFWVLFSGDLVLEANQPNTEIFINVFLTWGLYFWLRADEEAANSAIGPLLAGLCIGIATLYKQPVIIAFVVLITFQILMPRPARRKRVIKYAFLAALPVVASWAAVTAYFTFTGRKNDFIDAVFRFNFHYTDMDGLTAPTFIHLLKMTFYKNWFLVKGLCFVLLCGLGLGIYRKDFLSWTALAAYSAGLFLCIVFMRHQFPHYYQLLMPSLVVAAAWLVQDMASLANKNSHRWATALGLFFVTALLWREVPFYRFPADVWSYKKYGALFYNSKKHGLELATLLPEGETFYMWGYESGLYYYSRRSPPTGVIFSNPVVREVLSEKICKRVIEDLSRRPPLLIVVAEPWNKKTPQGLRRWIEKNYSTADPKYAVREGVEILERKSKS